MLFPDEAEALAPHNHSAPASSLPKLQRSTPATPKRLLANKNNINTLKHNLNASSSQQMNFPSGSGVSFIPGYFVIQENSNQNVQPPPPSASSSSVTKENAAPKISASTPPSSSSPKVIENKVPIRQQPGQVVDAQDFFPEFLNLPLNPPYWRKSAHKFLEASGMLSHSVNEEGSAASKSPVNSPLSHTASSIRRRRARGSNQENNNNNNSMSSIPEIDIYDDDDYYDDQQEGPNWRNLHLNSTSPKQNQRSPKLTTIADIIQGRINRGGSEAASTHNTPTRYTVDDYYFSSPTPEKNINKSRKQSTNNQRQDLNITPKRATPTTGNNNNHRNSTNFDHRYDLENERVWAASDQLVAELLQRENEERKSKERQASIVTGGPMNNKPEKRVSIRDNTNTNHQIASFSAPPTPTASNNVDRFKRTQAVIVVPPSMFFDPNNKSSSTSSSAVDYNTLMANVAQSTPASFNPYVADTSARLFKPRTDDMEEKKKAVDLGLRRTPGKTKPVVAATRNDQQPMPKQEPAPMITVTTSPVSALVTSTDDNDDHDAEEENKKKESPIAAKKKDEQEPKIEEKSSQETKSSDPLPAPTKSTSEISTSPMKFQQENQQEKEKEKQKSNPPSPSHSVAAPANASVQCQTIEDRGTQTIDNTLVDRGLPPPNHQRQNPESAQLSRIGVYQLDSPPRIHQQQVRRNQNVATNKNFRQPSLGNDSAVSEITPNGGNQNSVNGSAMGGRNRISANNNNNNNRNNSGASAFSSNYSSASVSGSTAASGKRRGIAINARLLARAKPSESSNDEVDEIAEREAELRFLQQTNNHGNYIKNNSSNNRTDSSPRLRYALSPEKRGLALSRNGSNDNTSVPSPTLNKNRNSPEVSQDAVSASLLNSLSTSILVNPIAINRIRRDNITQKFSRTPSRERNQNTNDAINNSTNAGTPLKMNNNNSSLPSSPIPPLAPTTPRNNNSNNIYNVNPILLPTPPRQQQQQQQSSPVSSQSVPGNALPPAGSPPPLPTPIPTLLSQQSNEPKQPALSRTATTASDTASSPQRTPKVTIVVDGEQQEKEQTPVVSSTTATAFLPHPSTNIFIVNNNASSPENNNSNNGAAVRSPEKDEVINEQPQQLPPAMQDASFSAASPTRKNTEAFDESSKPNSDEADPVSLHNISMTVSNSNNLLLSSPNSSKDISENEKQEVKNENNNSNEPQQQQQQQVMDPEDLRETVETFEKAIELYRAELAKEQKRRKMAEQQLATVLKRGGATNVVGNNNNSNARTNSVGRSTTNSVAGTPSSRSGSQVPVNNNHNNVTGTSSAVRLQRLPSINKNSDVKNGNDDDDDDDHVGDVTRKKAGTNLTIAVTGDDDSSLLTSRTLRPTVDTTNKQNNNNNPNQRQEKHEPLSPAPPGLPMFKTPFANSSATAIAGSTNKNNAVSSSSPSSISASTTRTA